MEIKEIEIRLLRTNIGQIDGLPKNPRKISKKNLEKLKKSVQDAPEMLQLRELIVVENGGEFVVIAGNQRLEAAKAVGMKSVPCKVLPSDTDPAKMREYAIKDNLPFGEDDWELLRDWDAAELEDWGMEMPEDFAVNTDDYGTDFELPSGKKSGIETMSFILSAEQKSIVTKAINEAKKLEEYKYLETFGNSNSNGNALYLIISQWVNARK